MLQPLSTSWRNAGKLDALRRLGYRVEFIHLYDDYGSAGWRCVVQTPTRLYTGQGTRRQSALDAAYQEVTRE